MISAVTWFISIQKMKVTVSVYIVHLHMKVIRDICIKQYIISCISRVPNGIPTILHKNENTGIVWKLYKNTGNVIIWITKLKRAVFRIWLIKLSFILHLAEYSLSKTGYIKRILRVWVLKGIKWIITSWFRFSWGRI